MGTNDNDCSRDPCSQYYPLDILAAVSSLHHACMVPFICSTSLCRLLTPAGLCSNQHKHC